VVAQLEDLVGKPFDFVKAPLGNLLSRVTALAEWVGLPGLSGDVGEAPSGYHEAVKAYRFDVALSVLWEEVGSINRELGIAKPWSLVKAGNLRRRGARSRRWQRGWRQ
jgi:hypothetical protein